MKRKPTGQGVHRLKQPRRKGLRGRDRLQRRAALESRATREQEAAEELQRQDDDEDA